jgi:hypothetical protein
LVTVKINNDDQVAAQSISVDTSDKITHQCDRCISQLSADQIFPFKQCKHAVCAKCMTDALTHKKCFCCGSRWESPRDLDSAESLSILYNINPAQWYFRSMQLIGVGTAATSALGTISYYIFNSLQSYQFNSLEHSVDSIINILISAEPNFDFDLYNSPFELLGLQVQYNLDSIVHSVSSNELKITLENTIKNFDKSFDVVWYALDKGGYYAKGKSAFMRDKKQQVENLRVSAQALKSALAECRAQVSVWKQVLGVTAAGALGIGAWVYAQR